MFSELTQLALTPTHEKPRFAMCGVCHQERFEDCTFLIDAVDEYCALFGIAIRGEVAFRGERKYLKPLPAGGLLARIPADDFSMILLGVDGGELEITRWPIFGDHWSTNVQLRSWLFEPTSFEDALARLKAFVDVFQIFWGEANDVVVTKYPTFCGVNEHYCRVPGLGLANYFGAEYIRYFGGVERFMTSAHLQVEPFGSGLITTLPCSSFDEFVAKRAEIRHHLGDLLFEPAPAPGGCVDPIKGCIDRQLFWSEAQFDPTSADRALKQILEIEERKKRDGRSDIDN